MRPELEYSWQASMIACPLQKTGKRRELLWPSPREVRVERRICYPDTPPCPLVGTQVCSLLCDLQGGKSCGLRAVCPSRTRSIEGGLVLGMSGTLSVLPKAACMSSR